jgi:hypothetical protein
MDRVCGAMADRDHYGDTSAEERAGTREHFLTMSQFSGNVERRTTNVEFRVER